MDTEQSCHAGATSQHRTDQPGNIGGEQLYAPGFTVAHVQGQYGFFQSTIVLITSPIEVCGMRTTVSIGEYEK